MKANTGLILAMVAGCGAVASAADVQPGLKSLKSYHAGHIYYNVATGERVVINNEQQVRDLTPVWIADNDDPCGLGGTIGVVSDAADASVDDVHISWGDIPTGSVIDCVTFDFGATIPDVDADMDGIGDGIAGYNLLTAFSSETNGFGETTKVYLAAFTLTDLPANTPDVPAGFLAVYEITLDLANDFVDGDGNPVDLTLTFDGPDLDGDDLSDFGYAHQFEQPSVGGAIAGRGQVAPTGNMLPDAQGLEDAVDIYDGLPTGDLDADLNSSGNYVGTFFFGGFDCATDTPFSQMEMSLFGGGGSGPTPCNAADTAEPFGELDFFDVQTYLGQFSGDDLAADLAPVGAPDGVLDFFDVQVFLAAFSAGCP
jgi:hypothetical protein